MSEAVFALVRGALAGQRAWFVGGAVRDRLLGRDTCDVDVVLDGDPRTAARELERTARAAGEKTASFPLSERFGAWRVVARDASWQIDVEALREGSIEADLALRDFTINAIAEPVGDGGAVVVDPFGGLSDVRDGCVRMVARRAFADDPLRVLRLVRIVVELDMHADAQTLVEAGAQAGKLADVSSERVFVELQRTIAADGAIRGLALMQALGAIATVMPELEAMRGVQQSQFHHRDVYGHTLEVLEHAIELQREPAATLGSEHAEAVSALLAEPLADGLTRGQALRWGALLHDAAKPTTRAVRAHDGRVTFVGHDREGAQLARDLLGRLRTSVRLREHVSALVRHHLRLGFLVHQPQPLAAEAVYDYLMATEPVQVDVTLLSVADRLATRGAGSEESIGAHTRLARHMLGLALRWRAQGPPRPLLRGDELAAELQIEPGPRLGELLEQVARAQYAGQVQTREQAIEFARSR